MAEMKADNDFPPQQTGETDVDFLLRALRDHQDSHQTWVTHFDDGCSCHAPADIETTIVSKEYQQECVARYERLIAIAKKLASQEEEIRQLKVERDKFKERVYAPEHILISSTKETQYWGAYRRGDEAIISGNLGAWYQSAVYWRNEAEKKAELEEEIKRLDKLRKVISSRKAFCDRNYFQGWIRIDEVEEVLTPKPDKE